MKTVLLVLACSAGFTAAAQPRLIEKAVISTTTTVIAPEGEDVSQIGQGGGGFGGPGGGMRMMNFMDGETKSTTFVQGPLTKTAYKSEMAKGAVYRDNEKKTTTTVIEAMGNKFGFGGSDEDVAQGQRRGDSLMKVRMESGDTSMRRRMPRSERFPVTVVYTEESKKIAGFNAKKAWLITDKVITKDSMAVWYTPDIKFANVAATGGLTGFSAMGGGTNNAFDKIDGFVLAYDQTIMNNRTMEVRVTKIEMDKDINVKEFEVPKDVEIRSMKDMGNGGGGFRMMMRQ